MFGMSFEESIALDLYRAMPGAPPIPRQNGDEMVGDVMGNAHWNFCEAIGKAIIAAKTDVRH